MIEWEMILTGEGTHKEQLEHLYKNSTLERLAEDLGVSKGALRDKLLKETVALHPKGGYDPVTRRRKSVLDAVPEQAWHDLSVADIAAAFDMDPSVVYKYARRNNIAVGRKANADVPGESVSVQAAENTSDSSMDERVVDTGRGHSKVQTGDVDSIDKTARRGLQGDNTKGGDEPTE